MATAKACFISLVLLALVLALALAPAHSRDVTVAVVDTGIDYSHPDLFSNIVTGAGPAGPRNFGVDFSQERQAITPHDNHGHGTHVAGIIKALHPQVRILALKFYDPSQGPHQSMRASVQALEYAVEQGVDIINYSAGGEGPSLPELRALKKAHERGILVVAAAGNDGLDLDRGDSAFYPASYRLPNVLSVINVDRKGQVWGTSNFGKERTDVAAPGVGVKSTKAGGGQEARTGTSQATAYVTGVAALLLAKFPTLKAHELKSIIIKSARPAQGPRGKCAAEGIADAPRALEQAKRSVAQVAVQGIRGE